MKLSAATNNQTTRSKIIQLVSCPYHKESPKDGALMLTATLYALCEDGTVLRRQFNASTRKWVWEEDK